MNTNRAFTLVETLVAITVLMIAVAWPLTIANRALRAALNARDEVVANYLAQDALEMVKNIRDNNYLTTNGATFPPAVLGACIGGSCALDTTVLSPVASAISCATTGALCTDSNGHYTHSCLGNTASIYTRTIQMTVNSSNANEYTVVVTVSWTSGGITYYQVLKDSIYNAIR